MCVKPWAHHRCSVSSGWADGMGDEIAKAIKGQVHKAGASRWDRLREGEPRSLKAQQLFKGRVLVDCTGPSSIQSPAVPRDVGLERETRPKCPPVC